MSSPTNEVLVAFQPASRIRACLAEEKERHRLYPARIARQLAVAHALQKRIESGEFPNQAALARALGFSRERISKLLDLLLLAPDIQEEILFLECPPGNHALTEHDLHGTVASVLLWGDQRRAWTSLSSVRGTPR